MCKINHKITRNPKKLNTVGLCPSNKLPTRATYRYVKVPKVHMLKQITGITYTKRMSNACVVVWPGGCMPIIPHLPILPRAAL